MTVGPLAGALLAALLSPAAVAAGVLPVAAQPPPDPAEEPRAVVTIDTLSPAVPVPGDTVLVTGTVVNQGSEPLQNVQALLRYSGIALAARSEVGRVLDDPGFRYGRRDDRFFHPVAEVLRPGQRVRYRLRVPVDDLRLAGAGAYAVGVDVRATPPSGARATLDTERTVLTWLAGAEPEPVPVALLWPLVAAPALLADGTLVSADVAGELAGGGRLDTLLSAPGDAPVSWLVDPDLLATAAAVASGAPVRGQDDGRPTPGSAAARAARDWLGAFGRATAGRQVALLPYADPDVVAATDAGPENALAVAADAGEATAAAADELSAAGSAGATPSPDPSPTGQDAVPRTTFRTDLVRPTGDFAGPEALSAYLTAGAGTVVLSAAAVAPTPPGAASRVQAGPSPMDAVLSDPGLDDALADLAAAAPGRAAELAFRQRWLAETALAALGVGAGEPPRALVAAPEQRWAPEPRAADAVVRAWTGTDWVEPLAVGDVEAGIPADTMPLTPRPAADGTARPLTAGHLTEVADLVQAVGRLERLLADPGADLVAVRRTVVRALSAAWRGDPDAGSTYLRRAAADVQRDLRGVSVLVPDSVTLSSRSGVFPLTIANDLDRPVEVRLDVRPANPDRLTVGELPLQRVEAGEKVSVDVTARAAANGRVPVLVSLATEQGDRVGTPRSTLVVATDYGTIGWLVIGGGAVLLASAVTLRLRRARRQGSPAPTPVPEEVR